MRFTTLLNYHLTDWWCNVNFFVCLLDDLIQGFSYSNLTLETGGFELASTITLALKANRLIKCAGHTKHDEPVLLPFKNYSLSLSILSSKNNRRYSKKCAENKCVCFNELIWLMTMKIRLKMKTRSHRYDINRPRSRHRHKYTKYKMILAWWWLYVLSNT